MDVRHILGVQPQSHIGDSGFLFAGGRTVRVLYSFGILVFSVVLMHNGNQEKMMGRYTDENEIRG